ncbi:MAG: hypothetical protein ABFS45_21185 [Pseudomonadota bacterium]
MNKRMSQLLTSISIFSLMAVLQQASAVGFIPSKYSEVVQPTEGNSTCADYTANSLVLQMSAKISCSDTDVFAEGDLEGPDSIHTEELVEIRPGDLLPETASYRYNCATKEVTFYSSIPINYALTKASKKVTNFIYSTDGAWEDKEIFNQDPDLLETNDQIVETASLALCYDLPGTGSPPPVTTVPQCNSDANNAWLGAISCTNVGDGTVVYLVQPGDPDCAVDPDGQECSDRGAETMSYSCVCNDGDRVKTMEACSPNPEGQTGNLKPCYDKSKGQSHADYQTGFSPDPVWYTTSGGDAEFSCIDNPFTSVNECD